MADTAMIDLTQNRAMLGALYAPPAGQFSIVDVPQLPFAVLDGKGPPEPPSVAAAVKALYTAIYPIRREARKRMGKSFVEPPVELLYWADDMRDFAAGYRENWHWRVQITLPVWADRQSLAASVHDMRRELGEAAAPRWEAIIEGSCVQILHIGPTDDLPALLAKLYGAYLPQEGLAPVGPYHEIYLDDWQRVAPAQRKVILRQPVGQLG